MLLMNLWTLLNVSRIPNFLSEHWRIVVFMLLLSINFLYISHLRSQVSSRDAVISSYESEVRDQKSRIALLEEQAKNDNTKTLIRTRYIEREARNARPEDNAPFNPALGDSLRGLWELDQSRRNQ